MTADGRAFSVKHSSTGDRSAYKLGGIDSLQAEEHESDVQVHGGEDVGAPSDEWLAPAMLESRFDGKDPGSLEVREFRNEASEKKREGAKGGLE